MTNQNDIKKPKILTFILAYNAKDHICPLLDRIPADFWLDDKYDTEVLVVDDASTDDTVDICTRYGHENGRHIRVLTNPINQGYGGNQKIGYTYAIEYDFDIVIMLHGDGQYPPEYLQEMVDPILEGKADIVFGSRMKKKSTALKGGMPYYKFLGNIVLTKFQNILLGSKLSEFHTGYRAFSIDTLKKIPFAYNSNDFDFDTDIIIQGMDTKCRIAEIAIPTHYGDEVCHVNGVKYAFQVARSTLLSRIQPWGIYYNPKFDYPTSGSYYASKIDFDSSHQFAIDYVKPDSTVLDFGCGDGHIAKQLKEKKNCTVYGYDIRQSNEAMKHCKDIFVTDLDKFDWSTIQSSDAILLLDIIEHLSKPEAFLQNLRKHLKNSSTEVVITTGNVVFCLTRLSFMIGQFNYGKRGILDLDHKRLFTFGSLQRLLRNQGYEVTKVEGIPVPIPFILGNNSLSSFLLWCNRMLIKLSKGMFSFQIAVVARPLPTLDKLLLDAKKAGRSKVKQAISASNTKKQTEPEE